MHLYLFIAPFDPHNTNTTRQALARGVTVREYWRRIREKVPILQRYIRWRLPYTRGARHLRRVLALYPAVYTLDVGAGAGKRLRWTFVRSPTVCMSSSAAAAMSAPG